MQTRAPGVEQRVSEVGAAVGARLHEVTSDIVALLVRDIDPLRDDERVISLLSASVEENVANLVHIFQHGIDPATIEAPAAAIEYSRRLAQRAVPMVALVRAYRIGQARFLRWRFAELMADEDPRTAAEASQLMTSLSFTYIDRISEQVIDFYQAEHDRWLHNRATVQMARVRSVLAEEAVDVDATETMLGYRLRRRHVGPHRVDPSSGTATGRSAHARARGDRTGDQDRCTRGTTLRTRRRVHRMGLVPGRSPVDHRGCRGEGGCPGA